jgi:HSP20 family molecular chaperone IbpA
MANDLVKTNTDLAEPVDERIAIAPPVDIYENADEYLLVADVPGATSEAVKLHLEEGQLTLRAARNGNTEYKRGFYLPEGVDFESTAAAIENGVLSIHLPKSAQARPRRINVKQL